MIWMSPLRSRLTPRHVRSNASRDVFAHASRASAVTFALGSGAGGDAAPVVPLVASVDPLARPAVVGDALEPASPEDVHAATSRANASSAATRPLGVTREPLGGRGG